MEEWTSGEGVAGAARLYLEGRIDLAVQILERQARSGSCDPATARASGGMLRALDGLARLDPQFRRERRALRERLLVLSGIGENPSRSAGAGSRSEGV